MAHLRIISIALLVASTALFCPAQKQFTVVLTDGHQKNFSVADGSRIEFSKGAMLVSQGGHQESIPVANIVRIDFNAAASKSLPLGRNHFVGKWEFGTGPGLGTFFVTLDANGQAHKSLGASHGTWEVVNGEAHISWDDGWRDVLRKVGDRHEKQAHEPGTGFDSPAVNVTNAKTLNNEPI
jgi:hypothetical protein